MLAPDSVWAASLTDANLASTVLVARVGAVRFLFTGDAEGPEEDWLLARDPAALAADVLKVGHHGSSTSTTAPFLAAVHPRLALVSVGAHNAYGHPDAAVMQALHASRRAGAAHGSRGDDRRPNRRPTTRGGGTRRTVVDPGAPSALNAHRAAASARASCARCSARSSAIG